MITKFKNFLLERSGYPEPIEPYKKLIIKHCNKYIEEYFNRKGKFANYSINFEISFNEIKNIVTKEEFLKYPVESMRINFVIKVSNVIELGSSGAYYNIGNDIEINTYYEKSESGWIDTALHLRVEFSIDLPLNLKSYDFEKGEKFIIAAIEHELTHSYSEFKGIIPQTLFYRAIRTVWDDYAKIKIKLKKSKPVDIMSFAYDFLFPLYLLDKGETNAYTTEANEKCAKRLKNYSADEISQINLKYLKKYARNNRNVPIKLMNYLDNIGNRLVEEYLIECKYYNQTPKKSILKLKGMTYRQLLDYYEPIFRSHGEYMQRKIDKLKYSKQIS